MSRGSEPIRLFSYLLFVAVLSLGLHFNSTSAQQLQSQPTADLTAIWRTIFARPDKSRPPAPDSNPITEAKRDLGQQLFFDTRLSREKNRSCASCHQPKMAFADGGITPLGRNGKPLRRNTPSLYNLAWGKSFYWDGRAGTLEAQARFPIEHPNEMGVTLSGVARRLEVDPEMARAFSDAFPTGGPRKITGDRILMALATYERTLVSQLTKFDAWVDGDDAALSARELAGFSLFVGKAGCVSCHVGWRFADNKFHDIGLSKQDIGRGAIAGGVPALPAFKTPGLRELTRTAPYMHDGSLPTLRAVIDHYAGGFRRRKSLATNMVKDLLLTKSEKDDMIAFLRTLSSQP